MNFFYKETRKKQLHYYRNNKSGKSSSFSIGRNIDFENIDVVSPTPIKLFRFSILFIDLLALNVIKIALFHLPYFALDANNQPFFITINLSWIFSSYLTALYFGRERLLLRTIQAYFLFFAFTLLLNFLLKSDFTRGYVLANFLCFGLSLVVSRVVLLGASSYIKHNMVSHKYIVLGCNELSHRLVTNLKAQNSGNSMAGFFDDLAPISSSHSSFPVLGCLNDCLAYAVRNGISEIYSTIPPERNPDIYEIAHEAEMNFIRFRFVPDFSVFINKRVHVSFVEDLPVLSLRQEPLEDIGNRFKKRVFDVVFSSLIILFVLSWLVPIIALLIKLDSRGPVFFKQLRSGKNNQPFLCFKFRSLTVNDEANSKQVTKNDTRYTRLGRFLRKSNLDEFPQFFNVFQGYMSIVGPRPHMLRHTQQYSEEINQYMIRHYVKPGITGLAQVNGFRGEITKEDDLAKRIEFDIKYMENWGMLLDIQIILQTIYVTFKGDKNAF